MKTLIIVGTFTSLALVHGASPQTAPSIRERAMAAGGVPITMSVMYDVELLSAADLAANADLIVEGRLVRLKSYYWPEEDTIYTDYRLIPNQIISERGTRTNTSPGPSKPVVVTLRGGEVLMEGTPVTLVDSTRKVVNENTPLLLFLKRRGQTEPLYEVYGAAAGMFEIDRENVLHSTVRNNQSGEFHGLRVQEALTRIKAAVRPK